MENHPVRTVLCLASYEKGHDFLREARRLGCHVILVTLPEIEHADWPRDSIDELFVMPDLSDLDEVTNGVSYLARTHQIDRIVALDDYDVPMGAALREHLRLPGMGQSLARRFRDKLAMRVSAREGGVLVPEFVGVINYERIGAFLETVPPPWVLKPRAEVSSIGIARIDSADEVWRRVEELGDRQSHFLLERFVPGDVYHVDSIVNGGQVRFAEAHQYARPPMEVFHGGGVSMSRTVSRDSDDEQLLQAMNRQVLAVLGMESGIAHAEFIKSRADGRFYFLEIGARVGGAYTTEMVEAATGINLGREWARLEVHGDGYTLPPAKGEYGGVIISLARQEAPDTSAYVDPEIVYRVQKRHHVGFVLASPDARRIAQLQDEYSRRIDADFAASMPAYRDRPPSG